MNRRDSVLDHNETSSQPSQANPNATQQLDIIQYTDVSPSAAEVFDATAAALSRLTVMTDRRAAGSASPALNSESTYETSVMTSCPSPSKRSSGFFDPPLAESNLKRMRTEIGQAPYMDLATTLDAELASQVSRDDPNRGVTGLGIDTLSASCDYLGAGRERATSPSDSSVAISCIKFSCLRQRAKSAPPLPSTSDKQIDTGVKKVERQSQTPSPVDFSRASPSRLRTSSTISVPPITQQTLKELELGEIFKNAQLRHDIVHDPNLQFRPNTEGERGAKKRQEASRYWRAISRELETIQTWDKEQLHGNRLSAMFQEMRSILLSLVPSVEKAQVEATFDHELFIQTLNHGLFCPISFAEYLSSILKRHCAPMRDNAIDKMVTQLCSATAAMEFADALRSTFDVLEMMKLDVANHQLRTLRGYLLETSVEFERNWYERKFDGGIYSRKAVKEWFLSLESTNKAVGHEDHRQRFVSGFCRLFRCPARKNSLPATFTFDQGRVTALSKDIRELINLNLVVLLAKQLIKGLSNDDLPTLKSDVWAILSTDKVSSSTRWTVATPGIALYLAQRANTIQDALPAASTIKFAESWLSTNLNLSSPLHTMIQTRLMKLLENLVYSDLTAVSLNGQKTKASVDWGVLENCRPEVNNVATRMLAVADYHWKVHGHSYIAWSNGDE